MKIFFRNFRKGLMLGVVIVAASLVAWFGYDQWGFLKLALIGPQSHQVVGVFKSINGNQLAIFGNHIDDNTPNLVDFVNRQDLVAIIEPDTKFVKLVWYFPESLERLTQKRPSLKPADIKKEKLAGSIEELKNMRGVSVKIKTEKNIIKKETFDALEIEYTVFVYPK